MKCVILLLFAINTFAVLPPLAQSSKEIQAILKDPQTYNSLGGGEPIREIVRNENGYLVVTNKYAMQVDIKYIRGVKLAGPTQFELEFYPPVEIR